MSIEQTIAANTAALTAQTAAIDNLAAMWKLLTANATAIKANETITTVKAGGVPVIEKATDPKPAPTPAAPVTVTPTPEASAPAEPAAASPSEAPAVVEMKDLSAAVTAAATRNRDGLVALLGKHNVKRASELPQDKWAALVTELEAL